MQHGVGVVKNVALGDLGIALLFLVLAFDVVLTVVGDLIEIGESFGSESFKSASLSKERCA